MAEQDRTPDENPGRGVTPYSGTGRTAPRHPSESRIGTDEAHQRLQEARNRAKRSPESVAIPKPDLPSPVD